MYMFIYIYAIAMHCKILYYLIQTIPSLRLVDLMLLPGSESTMRPMAPARLRRKASTDRVFGFRVFGFWVLGV